MVIAKGNNGATNHCWKKEEIVYLQLIQRAICPEVTLPDNSVINSDQQVHLSISSKLSSYTQKAAGLPHLKSLYLVSLGKLCDNNYKVLLDRRNLYVVKNK